MPLNGYKSDDIGNKGCMACIGKVLETLADTTLVRVCVCVSVCVRECARECVCA